MSDVDELRGAFELLAAPVVPQPDPYGRLMQRSRRRWRTRLTAFLGALVALALVGGGILTASGVPDSSLNPWVRLLLAGPIRGDLAQDRPFVNALTEFADDLPEPDRPTTKVLFAGVVDGHRAGVVVRYSAASAVFYVPTAGADGQLASTTAGIVTPVVAAPVGAKMVILAPNPCDVSTSFGFYAEVGQVHLWRFQPSPLESWVIVDQGTPHTTIEVKCGDVIRQRGPVNRVDGIRVQQGTNGGSVIERATEAYNQLSLAADRGGRRPFVQWEGHLPGDTSPAVLLAGSATGAPMVLFISRSGSAIVALGPPGYGSRPYDADPAGYSLVSTADAFDYEIGAIRIPAIVDGTVVLSDQVLVLASPHIFGGSREGVGPPVRVEAIGPTSSEGPGPVAQAPVVGGIAVLTVPMGGARIRAFDAQNRETGLAYFAEPPTGRRLFNMPFVDNWS